MASTISDPLGENRPVVVLGASGRLGSMLRAFWPGTPPLVAHAMQSRPGFHAFDLMAGAGAAEKLLERARAVICLAGVTPARAQATGEALSRNTDLALACLRAAQRAGAGRVFLASSAAVYGRATGPLRERMAVTPLSDYGRAKRDMEEAAHDVAGALGHPVTSLRIGNVAGADAILGGWKPGMQIDAFADGSTPSRSYIGPHSFASMLHQLCGAEDLPDTLNLACPGSVQMGELLNAAGRAWTPRRAGPEAIAQVELCTALLERHVTLAPGASTAAGMVAEWHDWQERRQA